MLLRRNVTFSHVFRPFFVATRSSTINFVAGALSYPDFALALPRLYDTRTDLARRLLWDRVPIELCVHPIGRHPTRGAPVEGGSVEAPHRRATLFELVLLRSRSLVYMILEPATLGGCPGKVYTSSCACTRLDDNPPDVCTSVPALHFSDRSWMLFPEHARS